MSKSSNEVPTSVTYYREYGLHQTPDKNSPTYIASAPSWTDMEQLLKFQMPHSGDVVTNDYATLSDDIDHIPDNMDEISERVRAVRMMSLRTDATVHLGTPHRAPDGHIYTSALSIHRGAIAGATYKSMLYPIEEEMGMTRANPKANQHVRDNGTALAICSDLICTKYEFSDQERQRARRLFGLTAWAYTEGNNEDLIEKAGGEDAYYQEQLEKVIGGYVLPYLPNVTSVVIADEGRPDLAPYNAAFSRQY